MKTETTEKIEGCGLQIIIFSLLATACGTIVMLGIMTFLYFCLF